MKTYGDIVVKTKKTILISEQRIIIAQMIADDYCRKDIAEHFKVSVRTIETHCNLMRTALGCQSIAATIASLMRKGLIK